MNRIEDFPKAIIEIEDLSDFELFDSQEVSKVFINKDKTIVFGIIGDTLSHERIVAFLESALLAFKDSGAHKFLIFMKDSKGSMSDSMDYFQKDWIPRAKPLGYSALAVVQGMDPFVKFSLNFYFNITKSKSPAKRKLFDNYNQAFKWIQMQT